MRDHLARLACLAVITVCSMRVYARLTNIAPGASPFPDPVAMNKSILHWREAQEPLTSRQNYDIKRYRRYHPLRIEYRDRPLTSRTKCRSALWGVTTTINLPTLAVQQIGRLGFCLAVVGDKKTPRNWSIDAANVIFLDVEAHGSLGYDSETITPFNSFARKTLGYLFAIQHGAESLYDFDDDNFFLDTATAVDTLSHRTQQFRSLTSSSSVTNVYKHYMGHPAVNIWPRGYPIELIKAQETLRVTSVAGREDVAVVQFLQSKNPDLDAIYRMTQRIPATFLPEHQECVRIDPKSYCPFNAQATWFDRRAFWGLLLPMTVNGRVSDIWRSYVIQRILRTGGQVLAFCPAIVEHERNPHNLMRDFNSDNNGGIKV